MRQWCTIFRVKQTPIPVSLTVEQAADIWLASYGSANTRLAYGSDLRAYLSWFDEAAEALDATAGDLTKYRIEREASGVAPATVSRQFAALRAFYATAQRLGVCAANPFGERHHVAPTVSPTETLTTDEIERLQRASSIDPRTAVLVQLLLGEGMRLAEVLALDHGDVSGGSGAKKLAVRRQGRSVTIPLTRESFRFIARLQRTTDGPGPLLTGPARRSGGRPRLTRFGADLLLKRAARSAGIARTVSANVLRRTHVTVAQRAGVHIDEIRDRIGHRDVRTTRRYMDPDSTSSRT
jgi:integrase/recombinase XerD